MRKKLLRCCQLELTMDDDLLQYVCDDCVQQLDRAWSFDESVAHPRNILHQEFAPSSVQETVEEHSLARWGSRRKLKSSSKMKVNLVKLGNSMASIVLEQHSTLSDIKYDKSF